MKTALAVRILFILVATAGIVPSPSAQKPDQEPAVRPAEPDRNAPSRRGELLRLLEEIRQERQRSVAEQEAWEQDRISLENETSSLRLENDRLMKTLPGLREQASRLAEEAATLEKDLKVVEQSIQQIRSACRQHYTWMETFVAESLPLARSERLEKIREARAASENTRTPLSGVVGEIMGLAFKILAESRTFSATKIEEKNPAGGRRVVDVLRIGTVQMLTLSLDDRWVQATRFAAGKKPTLGPPAEDPTLAATIRKALDILHRRRTPSLMLLPAPWPPPPRTHSGATPLKKDGRP